MNGEVHQSRHYDERFDIASPFSSTGGKTFIPDKITSSSRRRSSNSLLFMVSKKKKRKLQEETAKAKVYHELELSTARHKLKNELQNLSMANYSQKSNILSQKVVSKSTTKNKKSKNTNKNISAASKQTTKILKDIRHDKFLEDIGTDSRLLALEIYYHAKKPSEMVSPLLWDGADDDANNENTVLLDRHRLWAYSMLEDWDSALPYAERFYAHLFEEEHKKEQAEEDPTTTNFLQNLLVRAKDNTRGGITQAFSSQEELLLLTQFAIEAFAQNERYHSMAREMILMTIEFFTKETEIGKEKDTSLIDCPSSPLSKSLNSLISLLLQSYIGVKNWKDAKTLFSKCLQMQQQQQSKNEEIELLNKESHRLMLEVASKLSDTCLLNEVVGDDKLFKALDAAIISDNNLSQFANMMNIEKKAGVKVLELILKSLIVKTTTANETITAEANKTGFAAEDDRNLVRGIVRTLISEQNLKMDPRLLSNGLVLFRGGLNYNSKNESDYNEDLKAIARLFLNHKQKQTKEWYSSLTVPTRVAILPFLTSLEFKSNKMNENIKKSHSWQILTSMLNINNKNGLLTLSSTSRKFLRNLNDCNFGGTALFLTIIASRQQHEEGIVMSQAILEECREISSLVLFNSNQKYHLDLIVQSIFESIVKIKDEKKRNELYVKISNKIRQQVNSMVSSSSLLKSSNNEGSVKSTALNSYHEIEEVTKNNSLGLIANSTGNLMQSLSEAVLHLPHISSNVTGDNNNYMTLNILKNIATHVFNTAVHLVCQLEELSLPSSWESGAFDNGAKEALQMIMKQLILSNLLTEDDDLVHPAIQYYFALLAASASSSDIKYRDLMSLKVGDSDDSFQNFRDCIIGKQGKEKTNPFLSAVLSFIGFDEEEEEKEIMPLLQSIIGMTKEHDHRTGNNATEKFVERYKEYFLNDRVNLFSDHMLSWGLFQMLDYSAFIRETVESVEVNMELPGLLGYLQVFMNKIKEADLENLNVIEEDENFARYAMYLAKCSLSEDDKFSEIAGVIIWHLWGDNLSEGLFGRLSSCRDAQNVVSHGKDIYEIIPLSTDHLFDIYSLAGAFVFSDKLKNSYLEACRINCRYLVENAMSGSSIKLAGVIESENKIEKERKHFEAILNAFLTKLSSEESKRKCVKIDVMIKDVLDTFWDVRPLNMVYTFQDQVKKCEEQYPTIAKAIKAWGKENTLLDL